MAEVVSRHDPRYEALKRGHNLRWPAEDHDAADRIFVCDDASDIAAALQEIVHAGLRPTVRSGGHCYEDFVYNNPGGAILDLSLISGANQLNSQSPFRVAPGTQLWDAYRELYKRYGVTIPGGSCGTVCAGGHISGGGYGLLSRLHGLTIDWLTSVDILTVEAGGKVVPLTANATHHPDLFRACRGAGGGNFGIITSYNFDKLPLAPTEVVEAQVEFAWNALDEERFVRILRTFGDYWETRGQDPDTWGMFSVLVPSHRSGPGFGMSVQFCNPDGTCSDLSVLNDYLDRFTPCGGVTTTARTRAPHGPSRDVTPAASPGSAAPGQVCLGMHPVRRRDWLSATGEGAGGPGGSRAKYKSAYMKRGPSDAEARCIYKHMNRTLSGADLRGCVILMDSYGGAINKPAMAAATAIPQRSSILKLQPMAAWRDPAQDAAYSQWLRDFYTDLFSGPDADPRFPGYPHPNQHYEGCYINYPDKDMLAHPRWHELYYGTGELYPFLQGVKRKYDPNNIFHHAMSIRI